MKSTGGLPGAWPALALALLIGAGCVGGGQEERTGEIMDKWHVSDECDFAALRAKNFEETPCSPVVDDAGFQGLLLHAPEVVRYEPDERPPGVGTFADVRVCGVARFEYGYLGLQGRVQREILIVAVDAATQETYSGRMPGVMNEAPRPDSVPQGGGPTDGLVVQSYFNPNLAEVLELPERPAEYIVHAVLGESKSNTVRIRVESKD